MRSSARLHGDTRSVPASYTRGASKRRPDLPEGFTSVQIVRGMKNYFVVFGDFGRHMIDWLGGCSHQSGVEHAVPRPYPLMWCAARCSSTLESSSVTRPQIWSCYKPKSRAAVVFVNESKTG
jgi:hypothetical protein